MPYGISKKGKSNRFKKGFTPWNKGKKNQYTLPKGWKHTKTAKKKIGEISKRLWADSDYRKKMKNRKRRNYTEEHRRKLRELFTGENNPLWKGDDVGYVALHDWVKSKLGTPDTCKYCGKSGLKGRQIHWANISGKYKRELSDWIRLCVNCHMERDGTNIVNQKKKVGK